MVYFKNNLDLFLISFDINNFKYARDRREFAGNY